MTDTSRSGDLVKRLRYTAEHGIFTAHDNGMQAMPDEAADRIEALEAEVKRLREALQWMVDNDETNEGDEPMEDFGDQSWNEINAYWIEGLNRARAVLGGEGMTNFLTRKEIIAGLRLLSLKTAGEYSEDAANLIEADAYHIETVEAENERLRRVLARWQYSGCPDCSGDCGSANPPVMCCIMEETRAALGEKQ